MIRRMRYVRMRNPVQHVPHSASVSLRLRSGNRFSHGRMPRAQPQRSRPHTPQQERVSRIVCAARMGAREHESRSCMMPPRMVAIAMALDSRKDWPPANMCR